MVSVDAPRQLLFPVRFTVAAKKSPAKKPAAKRPAAKKPAAKKPAAKKPAAKKPAAKKPAAKKPAAKKPAAKKSTAATSVAAAPADMAALTALLGKTPNHASWRKVCEWLDACAPAKLDAALAVVEGEAARWDVNTNRPGLWELPARYTPAHWAKRILAGDVPAAFRVARLFQLHAKKVTDAGLETILDTHALGSISHLYLGSCELGERALPLLASHADELGALTHLVLCDNKLAPEGVDALLASPLAQRLVYLELSHTNLGDAAVAKLRAGLPALRELNA
jgi:hypothetical protein